MTRSTLARFWTHALPHLPTRTILLDGKPLRAPTTAQPVVFPSLRVLLAAAGEWEAASAASGLAQHSLPLTAAVIRAQALAADDAAREKVLREAVAYLHNDSMCHHAAFPENLVREQQRLFDPVMQWAQRRFGIDVHTTTSLLGLRQPRPTVDALAAVLRQDLSEYQLVAFDDATRITKSFLLGLALVNRAVTTEWACRAAMVETDVQTEQWGVVEDGHGVARVSMLHHLGAAALLASVPKQ